MAGYSGTPLVRKLGIKAGSRFAIVNPPPGFDATLGPVPEGATRVDPGEALDLIHLFTRSREELESRFLPLARRLAPAGMLWISWPKKASGVPTDLDEDIVRAIGLDAGLVDTKVCAVDEVWSALKFVYRLADRPARGPTRT